jgi:hypothetical protein
MPRPAHRTARAASVTFVLALLVAAAGGAAGEAVIPPGQEDLLADITGRGEPLAGCTFAGGQVDHSTIKATYACPTGEVVVALGHPGKAPAGATQTARFAITLVSGTPAAGFVDALATRVRARETAFAWTIIEPTPQGSPASSLGRPLPVVFAAAAILGLLLVGWALRRRRSGGRLQVP